MVSGWKPSRRDTDLQVVPIVCLSFFELFIGSRRCREGVQRLEGVGVRVYRSIEGGS